MRRNVVITGASSGLGRAAAHAFLARGDRVIALCRTPAAGEHVPCDLADFASIRAAAAQIAVPVHLLVNNAGVAAQRGQTKDGYEYTFGVNHLGHFLLTTLLGARLVDRVVNVASGSHLQARRIDWAALERPNRALVGMRHYDVSKLCNVLFTRALARRRPDLTVCAVHPGTFGTGIWRRMPWPVRPLVQRLLPAPDLGPLLHAATDPTIVSGAYYDRGAPAAVSALASDDTLYETLWAFSERAVARDRTPRRR